MAIKAWISIMFMCDTLSLIALRIPFIHMWVNAVKCNAFKCIGCIYNSCNGNWNGRQKSLDSIMIITACHILCFYDKTQRNSMQSSAFISMRCNIAWYCTYHCRSWGRISMTGWIHKRHPIPHPDCTAMGCLLWLFWRKCCNGTTLYCVFIVIYLLWLHSEHLTRS